ncbi:hypothetical protein MSC49_21290 [Methylosinus sp. C49]|jgi:hypothetical protein|nr:hypothetical protein MSC49_21290 [Methylosinus sp. C49]
MAEARLVAPGVTPETVSIPVLFLSVTTTEKEEGLNMLGASMRQYFAFVRHFAGRERQSGFHGGLYVD